MTFALAFHFHVYLPWVNTCLTYFLKCKSASRRFQPEEGPSRGPLRDCLKPMDRLQLYWKVASVSEGRGADHGWTLIELEGFKTLDHWKVATGAGGGREQRPSTSRCLDKYFMLSIFQGWAPRNSVLAKSVARTWKLQDVSQHQDDLLLWTLVAHAYTRPYTLLA